MHIVFTVKDFSTFYQHPSVVVIYTQPVTGTFSFGFCISTLLAVLALFSAFST